MNERHKIANAFDELMELEHKFVENEDALTRAQKLHQEKMSELLGACQRRFGDKSKRIICEGHIWQYVASANAKIDGEFDIEITPWTGVILDPEPPEVDAEDMHVVGLIMEIIEAKRQANDLGLIARSLELDIKAAKERGYKACHATLGEKSGCKEIIYNGRVWYYNNGKLDYESWTGIIVDSSLAELRKHACNNATQTLSH
jgi:hypothetical protein